MPPIRMISLIMRAPFRIIAAPCGVLLLSAFVANLSAQQPAGKATLGPAGATTKQAPPGGNGNLGGKSAAPAGNVRVAQPPLSPELEKILVEWEQKSAQIKSLKGKHTRFVYNKVFEVEKRAEGRFFLETPDKGRIDLTGVEIKKNMKSERVGKSGNPFRLDSDRSEKWICNGEDILMVNDEDKSYDVAPLPPHLRGTNIVKGPLPFLFGIKADDAKRRFQLSLSKTIEPSQHALLVVPLLEEDKQNYKIAKVCLDKKTFLPQSVMLLDPTGNLETHYYFEIQDVNNRNKLDDLVSFFGGDSDPYKPNLKKKGYKMAIHADPADVRGDSFSKGVPGTGATNSSRSNGSGIMPVNGQQMPRTGLNSSGAPRK